jgi:hypothetical protein
MLRARFGVDNVDRGQRQHQVVVGNVAAVRRYVGELVVGQVR